MNIFFLKKRSWLFEKKTLKVQNWIEMDKKHKLESTWGSVIDI